MKKKCGARWLKRCSVIAATVIVSGSLFAQDSGSNGDDEAFEQRIEDARQGKATTDAGAGIATYLWNRTSDFFNIFDVGFAVGPTIGGEVALTNRFQLGAHASAEKGFTSTLPPFWFVPAFDDGEKAFRVHSGVYRRAIAGSRGRENNARKDVRFPRKPSSFRLQLGLGIVHLHTAFDFAEAGDFVMGIVGEDPAEDDQHPDPLVDRQPGRQLGRSLTNITLGIWEIPKNMIAVNNTQGHLAGITSGTARGIWRFLARETVGVFELVTFPMGWSPIIRPEFVIQKDVMTDWDVKAPDFMD